MSNPGGSAATEAYDIFHPPQYQPDPDAARPEGRRLSAWEDAWVKDPGMESHPARAHLDTGKRIYSRAGLSDQGAQCRWDLLISHNKIQVFEEAGFIFSTRTWRARNARKRETMLRLTNAMMKNLWYHLI
ncbi:TPA: hypothetical protein ACH3X3_002630 [Trebouxia sp. C0006]